MRRREHKGVKKRKGKKIGKKTTGKAKLAQQNRRLKIGPKLETSINDAGRYLGGGRPGNFPDNFGTEKQAGG